MRFVRYDWDGYITILKLEKEEMKSNITGLEIGSTYAHWPFYMGRYNGQMGSQRDLSIEEINLIAKRIQEFPDKAIKPEVKLWIGGPYDSKHKRVKNSCNFKNMLDYNSRNYKTINEHVDSIEDLDRLLENCKI